MTGNILWQLLFVALPLAGLGFWWTSARARELAVEHARRACDRQQVQFLDQSVALDRLRPARSARGHALWRRDYRFEFTNHAEFRDTACVTMLGHGLLRVSFPYMRDGEGHRVYGHPPTRDDEADARTLH